MSKTSAARPTTKKQQSPAKSRDVKHLDSGEPSPGTQRQRRLSRSRKMRGLLTPGTLTEYGGENRFKVCKITAFDVKSDGKRRA